jgi:hypothetical protein
MTPSPRWPPWKQSRRAALTAAAVAVALGAGALVAVAGRGSDRAELARVVALAAWFAAMTWALRRRPRATAPREQGVPVLRASAPRRFALPLLVLPLALLAVTRAAQEGGNATAAGGLGVLVVAGLAWIATRGDRRFALLPGGLELRMRGGRALLRFDELREVRVQVYRRHAGLVLIGGPGAPSLGLSAWLDGVPELARALLGAAPPAALGPEARARLEALAAPYSR